MVAVLAKFIDGFQIIVESKCVCGIKQRVAREKVLAMKTWSIPGCLQVWNSEISKHLMFDLSWKDGAFLVASDSCRGHQD